MNGYTFDIHINCCFVLDALAQADVRFKYDLLEVGPLNIICFDVVNKVGAAVRSISFSPVPLIGGQSSRLGKTLELFFAQEVDYPCTL